MISRLLSRSLTRRWLSISRDWQHTAMAQEQIAALFQKSGCDVVKMETLRTVDGKPGFSLAQGQ